MPTKISETEFQRQCGVWVGQHIHCCMSSLVSDIGTAYWESPYLSREYDEGEIVQLFRSPDWEETINVARENDPELFNTALEAEGNPDLTEYTPEQLRDFWYEHLNNGNDIVEDEVYEHWAVDDHAAHWLQWAGCQVSDIFPMINLWCRGTTGQAILLDYAIRRIVSELNDVESNGSYT